MTKTFKTTFTNRLAPEQKVEIITKVTDKMENRNSHKRSMAVFNAHRKFEKEYKRYTEYKGKNILLWTDKTEEI